MFRLTVDDTTELRLLEAEHADELFALVDTNRQHLREWLPWVDSVRDASDTGGFIKESLEQFTRSDGFQTGIWSAGRLVGVIGLHYIHAAHRATSIGYWLAAAAQGHGMVTRSCRRLIDHVFDDLKLHRVEIRAAPGNERSRKIPRRLDFTLEGTLRDAEWLYDHFVDVEVYSMLSGEWAKGEHDPG